MEIKSFSQFVNENEAKRIYGCLMLQFEDSGWKDEITSMVDMNDVYEDEPGYGLETEPHCTILYGFHNETFSLDTCIKLLVPVSNIDIYSENISLFKNEKFEVLKYDIDSEQLKKLNSVFCSNFNYTNSFPDYHAHCTIAYLKPGTGDKYVKTVKRTFVPSKYKYSYGNGNYVCFSIKNVL